MAKTTGNRGMAQDGFSTRNFQDLGKSLTSSRESSIPVKPSAPVGQHGGNARAPQAPAPESKK